MNQTYGDPSATAISLPGGARLQIGRITVPARKVLGFAELQCAAESLISIDLSHLFAGLLSLELLESNGLRLLRDSGIDVESLALSMRNSGFVASPISWPPAPIITSRRSNIVLAPEGFSFFQEAAAIAASFGHERTGTEHLVLAFLSTPESYGFRVVTGFGVTLDSAKERFGRWMISGQYLSESLTELNSMHQPPTIASLDIVYRVYRWTQLGYLLLIFTPFAASFFLTATMAPSLFDYLGVMGPSIYLFVFPYAISTYVMSFLLRSRSQKQLSEAPPSKAIAGVAPQFAISIVLGFFLIAALIPMIFADFSNHTFFRSVGGPDIPAVIGAVLVTLNSITTVVTHWLLTLNIRGPRPQMLPGR
jgi:hypothetical protein